jgi:hypothetical protein
MTKEFKTVPSRSGLIGDQMWVADTRFDGDLSATAYDYGQVWNLPGGSSFEYTEGDMTATINGLGVGSLNYRGSAQTIDGVWSSESVIASGTADFEGASGTLILRPDPATPTDSSTGTYEWTITVPPKGSLQTVTATGTVVASDTTSEPGDREGETVITALHTFDGSMVGSGTSRATAWRTDSSVVGTGTVEFTGTIDGIGTGTMTVGDVFSYGPNGNVSIAAMSGGTGDFEGISGTGRYVQIDGTTWEYSFVLAAPVDK